MGERGGWGSLFFGKTTRGLQAVVPAQFRRGCPSDVPLRFGTGHGERGEERVMEGEREDRRRSEQHALSPHSSLLLQSGYLLDPQGRLSASLHTNSPLPQP